MSSGFWGRRALESADSWFPRSCDDRTIVARNVYNTEFKDRVAFWQATEPPRSFTCDRGDFIGRNRTLAAPAALFRERLGGRVGAGLDPCAALQVAIAIRRANRAGSHSCSARATIAAHAAELATRYSGSPKSTRPSNARRAFWDDTLGAVQVRTPDDSFDLLVNRWLLYQALSCRIWARSGPYQPGGAFGFRDQLQDVLSLLYSRPDLAARIFCWRRRGSSSKATCSTGGIRRPAGARGRAARTICSGCRTRSRRTSRTPATMRVLDEAVPFLEAPPLEPDQADAYATAAPSRTKPRRVYEHCVRAIDSRAEVRRARAAADRLGRLERRHEPRRPRGPRRERLARMVPRRRAQRVRRASAIDDGDGELAQHYRSEARWLTGMLELCLGRRLVSPRLFRRWDAARVGAERGVPASTR